MLENGLPVTVIAVAMYEDAEGRRFIDVDAEHDLQVNLEIAAGAVNAA
ncbi:MAG: hypothetical protein H0X22_06540 [Acidimicrobiia bacterium]|nr:hypothetical protein [Acidimicrobiia bacterium]